MENNIVIQIKLIQPFHLFFILHFFFLVMTAIQTARHSFTFISISLECGHGSPCSTDVFSMHWCKLEMSLFTTEDYY